MVLLNLCFDFLFLCFSKLFLCLVYGKKKKKRLEYRFKPPAFFVLSVCFRLANECILILLRTF